MSKFDDILSAALALPLEKRLALCEELRSSFEKDENIRAMRKSMAAKRVTRYVKIFTEIASVSERQVYSSRERLPFTCRSMIMYQMRKEGAVPQDLIEIFDKKHLNVVYNSVDVVDYILRNPDKNIFECMIWDQFQARLKDDK